MLLAWFFIVGAVMFTVMFSNVTPEKVDVTLLEPSPADIRSPKAVILENETEERKRKAETAVEDIYYYDKGAGLEQARKLTELLDAIQKINEVEAKKKKDEAKLTMDEKISQINDVKGDAQVSPASLGVLFNASSDRLESVKTLSTSVISSLMNEEIELSKVQTARENAEQIISQNASYPDDLKDAAVELTQSFIIHNKVLDYEKTRVKRKEARDSVQQAEIKEGEVIVSEGDLVTAEVYKRLELAGLTSKKISYKPFIGLLLFIILLLAGLYYFVKDSFNKDNNKKHAVIYVILFLFSLIMMKVVSLAGISGHMYLYFIVPIAAGTMMLKMLFSEQLALVTNIVLSLCAALIFNENSASSFNFVMALYILISGIAGVVYLGKKHIKNKIIRAGFFVSFVNICSVLFILLVQDGTYSAAETGAELGAAFISGFLSSVLTLGLLPVIESWFGILSTAKLIELSNPNHPLLRKVLMEAPGTYHHSIMVANLSEAACESVGANGLLARVGSYYHDVGKAKRPHFFIENQMNMENPHDKIAPHLSKTIITAHPYDGADMIREFKLPKEIVDIAEQHHGTTLLKYFYHKACQQSDKEISESEFRYPGPKAQTKETAIIGVSDAVEAAVRSLSRPTPVKIEQIIKKIIAERLEDGQFDECDITLKELDTVATTLSNTLKGIFHSRIEYPEEMKKVEPK
ncbi:hypothetical protein CGZ90_08665 [Fictibacillus aquaticus]|uniref:HD/PDEase domain-containing protein n=2 Tax=Fictibacillus aquaticus TaxID=2021314 RepID=A0A235FAV2_9BACL|nr:hypothetical protein CGZ90_08665 [Fictibacillus aquaticus]